MLAPSKKGNRAMPEDIVTPVITGDTVALRLSDQPAFSLTIAELDGDGVVPTVSPTGPAVADDPARERLSEPD